MIKIISWLRFQQLFIKTERIYVIENPDSWVLDVADGLIIIRCIVPKSEADEQNMAFVDRYLNNPNIVKVEYEVNEQVSLRVTAE